MIGLGGCFCLGFFNKKDTGGYRKVKDKFIEIDVLMLQGRTSVRVSFAHSGIKPVKID